MIGKLFITDPDQRIDIEGIRNHPWYKLHQPETQSFGAARNLTQINMSIVNRLEEELGFNKESLLKSIRSNKHNHLTATYYLILKKHMVKMNRPYYEAFLPDSAAKFTRVRQSKSQV